MKEPQKELCMAPSRNEFSSKPWCERSCRSIVVFVVANERFSAELDCVVNRINDHFEYHIEKVEGICDRLQENLPVQIKTNKLDTSYPVFALRSLANMKQACESNLLYDDAAL